MQKRLEQYESQKLAYRLLEGERCEFFRRSRALLHYSVLSAKQSKVGTVVLLHGVASNGSRWEEFIDTGTLKEHFDIVRCDLRGHAASVCFQAAGIEEWCDDLEAILDREKIDKAVVIGHSLGAQVTLNFAVKKPQRTLAAVLLDPLISEALTPRAISMRNKLPYMYVMECFIRAANSFGLRRKLRPQDLRQMDAAAREKIAVGGKELEEFIKQYSSVKADLQYIHSAVYLKDLREVGRLTPKADAIKVPTLVVGASSGAFTDADAMAKWVEELPEGCMASVQCAHWPMTECLGEVAGVIESWVCGRFSSIPSQGASTGVQPVGQARTCGKNPCSASHQ